MFMSVTARVGHDDQVDPTAQFLDWFKRPFPGQRIIFEYYRQLAQRPQAR